MLNSSSARASATSRPLSRLPSSNNNNNMSESRTVQTRPVSRTRTSNNTTTNSSSISTSLSNERTRARLNLDTQQDSIGNSSQNHSERLGTGNSATANVHTSSSTGKPSITIDPSLEAKLINSGLTGLQNLGNTCFMNSVLQCLSNTKPLLLFCFDDDLAEHLNRSSTSMMKGVLMTEYAKLIRNMWSPTASKGSIASPSAFKSTIGRFAPRFTGYSQQDSQEFLRYLLQGLHEDVNRVQRKPNPMKIDEEAEEKLSEITRAENSWKRCLCYENSVIADIFAGQLKSTLECSTCHYKSITFDMFWDLSIPLPRNKSPCNLNECIELFMSKEELDGNEKPTCARCKAKRKCTKKFSIQKCPDILVLHLKRFSQMRNRSKLNTLVEFPIRNLRLMDLTDVISESYQGPNPNYNLFGVSNHSGTAYSGHYIAQCKHPFNDQWFNFNDSSVHKINDPSQIVSSDAYVLFYERIK